MYRKLTGSFIAIIVLSVLTMSLAFGEDDLFDQADFELKTAKEQEPELVPEQRVGSFTALSTGTWSDLWLQGWPSARLQVAPQVISAKNRGKNNRQVAAYLN